MWTAKSNLNRTVRSAPYLFATDLFLHAGSRSYGHRSNDHRRAALAAASGGGGSVRVVADDLGRAGEGEVAYRLRRALLILKVGLVGDGALVVDRHCSPESLLSSGVCGWRRWRRYG